VAVELAGSAGSDFPQEAQPDASAGDDSRFAGEDSRQQPHDQQNRNEFTDGTLHPSS